MTYIDQLKYNSFVRNADEHFEKTQAISFYIIHRLARGKLDEKLKQNYKTIDNSRISLYPDKEIYKALSSAFSCSRKDFYFKKK